MAKRSFYPKPQRPKETGGTGGIYDDQSPFGASGSRTPYDLEKTDSMLDKIDDVLAEADNSQSETEDGDQELSPSQLREAEESGDRSGASGSSSGGDAPGSDDKNSDQSGDDKVGKGFSEEDGSLRDKLKANYQNNRKRYWIGGGLTFSLTGIIMTILISLLPLKLLTIVNNLQERFMASSFSSVQLRSEAMLSRYMKRHVIPGMKANADKPQCNSTRTISRDCVVVSNDRSFAGNLFNAWRDERFENKLADDFGLEVSMNPGTNRFNLTVGRDSPLDITDFVNNVDTNLFNDVGGTNKDMRRAMQKAFEDKGFWKRTFLRYKFGRFMERKFGLRRCVFACDIRQDFSQWGDNKKNAAKLFLIRRIIEPNSDFLGLALSCIISGSCVNDDVPNPSDDGTGRRSALEQQMREYLDRRGVEYADDSVEKLTELVTKMQDIGDQGIYRYVVTNVMEKVFNEQVAKMSEKFLPVVGWIDTGARVVNTIKNFAQLVKRYRYAIMTTAAATYFMANATFGDELKTGNVDAEIAGSMVELLGDEAGDAAHQDQPAENSPLYGALFEEPATTTSFIPSFFSGTALAADAQPKLATYICDDGRQIPVNQLVCDEERLDSDAPFQEFSDTLNTEPLSYVATASGWWVEFGDATLGKLSGLLTPILGEIMDIVNQIPFVSYIQENMNSLLSSLMGNLAQHIFPQLISVGMSGARAFNQMAMGASAAGSAYGQYGVGGSVLTDAQMTEIVQQQQDQLDGYFQDKSFFARMFDTDDSRSFASRLALSIPTRSGFTQNNFAGLLTNPFNKVATTFGSLLTTGKSKAAVATDPFGIPHFGWALDSTNFDYDPTIYTPEYCQQVNAEWEAGTGQFEGTLIIDEKTGADIHTKGNPCLLEAAAAGAAGGYWSTSVLTPEEVTGP